MNYTVETHSGRCVNLVEPRAESICIIDIAWSLSRQARFNGHTLGDHPYSVAQHSVYVADKVLDATKDRRAALHALLHDAHEAYMGDIVTPLKRVPRVMHVVEDIERALQHVIREAHGMNPPSKQVQQIIHLYDLQALAVEAYNLMPSQGADWALPPVELDVLEEFDLPMPPAIAYHAFLATWKQLQSGVVAAL